MSRSLGRLAGIAVLGLSIVGIASTQVSASTPDPTTPSSSTTPSTAPTTTVPDSTVPTTTVPPTTTPPLPIVIVPPSPDGGPSPATPDRGGSVQAAPTLPAPTTTTLPPHDALPANSGEGRRVVYSKDRMRVWTVNADNTVERTYLVSGRKTWNQPKAGTYSVFSRSRSTCNINNPNLCWRNMVRFTVGPGGDNIGFHEIPTNTRTGYKVQSIDQLGQALSGGCVRQAPWDAEYMWDWAPVGTKVVVLQNHD